MKKLNEIHHAYDNPDWSTTFQKIKVSDDFRVFHGWRDISDAVSAAKYGLSGKIRANRTYSYESDNNPHGLFVTISMKVATEFASASGHDQIIMEFNADVKDLEAPVWPGGSYTVQGQMSQFFGHGKKGVIARKDAQKAKEANPGNDQPHVMQSDRKHLASMLTSGSEYQALFVGDLSPDQIVAFHVRPGGKNYHYQNPWTKLTREQFLEKYGDEKLKKDDYAEHRVYGPNDAFDGDNFLNRLANRYAKPQDPKDMDRGLRWMWEGVISSKNKAESFRDAMNMYLWPKQMVPAMRWMKDRYKKPDTDDLNESFSENRTPIRVWYHPATSEIIKIEPGQKHFEVMIANAKRFGIDPNEENENLILNEAMDNGWVRLSNYVDGDSLSDIGKQGYASALNKYLMRRGLAWMEKNNYLPTKMEVEIGSDGTMFSLELDEIDEFIQTGKRY